MYTYDTLEDAKAKLEATMVYYDGKAVYVKQMQEREGGIIWCDIRQNGGRSACWVELTDPKLNFTQYNIGYTNADGIAVWWGRRPQKQFKQGLRGEQVVQHASNPQFYHAVSFVYCSPIIQMMENHYPSLEECEKRLKDQDAAAIAFHKNFAASYDKLHRDLILEYRGRAIGVAHKLKDFDLADDYKYLTEALKEAVG